MAVSMGERVICCMPQSLSNAHHNPLTLSVFISMLVVELIVFLSLDGVSEWLVTFCGDARTEVYEILRNFTKMYSREEQPMRFGFLCKIFGVANNGVLIGVDGNTSPLTRDPQTRYQLDELVISLMTPIWSPNFRSVPSFSFLFEVVKIFCIDQWIFLYYIDYKQSKVF